MRRSGSNRDRLGSTSPRRGGARGRAARGGAAQVNASTTSRLLAARFLERLRPAATNARCSPAFCSAPNILHTPIIPKCHLSKGAVTAHMCSEVCNQEKLTHYRPAMLFGNRIFYFKGSFHVSIDTIKKISPLWKPKISLFRHFPKLRIASFNGKKNP